MIKFRLSRLLKKINSENEKKRQKCAKKLGKSRDVRAVGPLINMLKDGEDYTRATAINVLGDICDMRAVPALLEVIHDDNKDISVAAALAMGKIRDSHTNYKFVPTLRSKDIEKRLMAEERLVELGFEWAEEMGKLNQ